MPTIATPNPHPYAIQAPQVPMPHVAYPPPTLLQGQEYPAFNRLTRLLCFMDEVMTIMESNPQTTPANTVQLTGPADFDNELTGKFIDSIFSLLVGG